MLRTCKVLGVKYLAKGLHVVGARSMVADASTTIIPGDSEPDENK